MRRNIDRMIVEDRKDDEEKGKWGREEKKEKKND